MTTEERKQFSESLSEIKNIIANAQERGDVHLQAKKHLDSAIQILSHFYFTDVFSGEK